MNMKHHHCKTCGTVIPPARLVALPAADTCVSCSTEQPVKGFMSWDHKTAPTFNVVTEEQHRVLDGWSRKRARAQYTGAAAALRNGLSSGASLRRPTFREVNACVETPSRTCRKCHNAPRATPNGLCVECALAWYAERNKWKAVPFPGEDA